MYTQVGFTLNNNQVDKLKKGRQNGEAITLELSPKQIGGEHDLYLTATQMRKLEKGAARIRFSKTQLKAQKGGFLGAILGLARTLLPKMLPILGTLGLSAASGAISGATHKATGRGLKRAGGAMPLYFSKSEVSDLLTNINRMEGSGVIPSGTSKKCMSHIEKQEGGFIGALLASLVGSLLPTLLGGKGLTRAGQSTGKGLRRAGQKKC